MLKRITVITFTSALLLSLNGYAVVPYNPMTPQFGSLLVLATSPDKQINSQELQQGQDSFLAREIPAADVASLSPDLKNTTFKDEAGNTYLALTSMTQLRTLDTTHNLALDFYEPSYPQMAIVSYQPDGKLVAKKLSDASIAAIEFSASPSDTGFSALKINGETIQGKELQLK